MKKKFLSLSAACMLAASTVTSPAMAQTPAPAGTTVTEETQDPAGSSDAEIAGLVIGSVALTLAAAGGAAYFAIQQGLIQNPLPGIIPGPAKPKPAPRPAPRYGAACTAAQALLPARGADGKWLTCVNMGQGELRWVYGPTPQGVGTATPGGYCSPGEQGGQDSRGRLMMCINEAWVYGP
ncbi:hypothetical protein [Corynebacterium endometrii]|uniref:Secreted protein n=1 Tax=Corynebacterium endometrii TaxID=2488819 RepID=A0A4P7QFI4_9CORY|nr:hypothetical protein [Corynebacterium endometrii]QCB27377.1 hypothetical protein CENDO_00335 [Corynebacterium endometrii]